MNNQNSGARLCVCVCLHSHVFFQFMKQWNDCDFRAAWYEHYSIRGYDIVITFDCIISGDSMKENEILS